MAKVIVKRVEACFLEVGNYIGFIIDEKEPRYQVFGIDEEHIHIVAIRDLGYMRKGEQTKIGLLGLAYVHLNYKEVQNA